MIRKANVSDILEINNLGSLLISNFKNTYNIKNCINSSNYILLVSILEKINGFILIRKNITDFEIEAVYVDENERKKGIASSLINYFLDNYVKNNCEILLEVAVDNIEAISLYKKFNFEIMFVRKKYYKDVDAYIMKKVIK